MASDRRLGVLRTGGPGNLWTLGAPEGGGCRGGAPRLRAGGACVEVLLPYLHPASQPSVTFFMAAVALQSLTQLPTGRPRPRGHRLGHSRARPLLCAPGWGWRASPKSDEQRASGDTDECSHTGGSELPRNVSYRCCSFVPSVLTCFWESPSVPRGGFLAVGHCRLRPGRRGGTQTKS